ncbi:MAG: pH regulation protein F [Candidatus Dactylopiibacterium carminicum]|uniref:PH regulation protein F n=1 Tax=Candidatus Dactylopiibacterium carminicum TaxID=857335 RepID=A0A272ERU5_9RHOO|nr:monovalent cation/H+ antiporter complex subunit F [Candidatus Dactylopiibacterium carminicum]KAF7598971.1 pH regulation protein F [Candidatus Dactylopiibacterium carminicum]PAS92843.1 MAG: pH regulation protein F [Candidatus Dactylopiibacterium carminicum]PAS96347.1 MAG: pH regulation protein F [Candidatus Dactylopiibacterium carminicum]PAS98981.1 MAG: hypothetical protein BSR46_10550 [Candidatus Dactylopiibacterium carminicum]
MRIEIIGASWVLPLALGMLAVSAVLIAYSLLRGPTPADRVVAIDSLSLLSVAVVTLLALLTGQRTLLDAALILALVSFLASTAFVLLFPDKRHGQADGEEQP